MRSDNVSDKTLQYYDTNASQFSASTRDVDFSSLQNHFLSHIPAGGAVLDLGCGSGRDSRAFLERGYCVTAVDGSEKLCRQASEYIRQDVICARFQDYRPDQMFDGIWACASLLHLPAEEIRSVMARMTEALKSGGCFYVSFKYGNFSGMRNGRYFTDLTENSFAEILKSVPDLAISEEFVTSDVRPGREQEKWLNVFLVKSMPTEKLNMEGAYRCE